MDSIFFIMMFELSHLISIYNILWFNSAAIIIYYICYTNVVLLISEYFFSGKIDITVGSK